MSDALDIPDLQIIGAVYGRGNVTSTVIGLVNRSTNPQTLSVNASNAVFGDTWPGVRKSLTVAYRYGSDGVVRVAVVREGETLNIGASDQEASLSGEALDITTPQLSVLAATYGPSDQTAKVQSMIDQSTQTLSVPASNSTFGDTWPQVRKALVVVAAYQGQVPFVDIVEEGDTYTLKYRPRLRILSASYGPANVLEKVRGAVFRRSLSISASNAVFGDTWPTVRKSLAVVYQYEGQEPQQAIATENSNLAIDYDPTLPPYQPPPTDPRTLNVIRAAYGPTDVTRVVASKVADNKLHFTASNSVFGDTWPNVRKSFSLCYSWGPLEPQSCLLTEGGTVDVQAVAPVVSNDLVSLAGLFGDGDKAVFEASDGYFWAVDANGKINASATSRESATEFTLHPVAKDPGQLTLSTPNGSVTVSDGQLQVAAVGTPAEFLPSVATTGSVVLGIAGNGFCIALDDGSVVASGRDDLLLDTACSMFLMPTQEGLENHLRAYGLDREGEEEVAVSLRGLKVAWDLTGGFVIALGLGSKFLKLTLPERAYTFLMENVRVQEYINEIKKVVLSTPGITLGVTTLFGFVNILYAEELLWPVLRMLLEYGAPFLIGTLVIQIVKWVYAPALAGVTFAVDLLKWAYGTTVDVLAWVNSGEPELMPA